MKNYLLKNVKKSLKYWYLLLIVGIVLVGTGLWTLGSPKESFQTLSVLFSLAFLIGGVLETLFAILHKDNIDNWGWIMVLGMMNTLVGFILLMTPEISQIALPLYVGFLIMFRSTHVMGIALDLKNYGNIEWGTLMVLGMLGLFFSFMLIWNPFFAGLSIVIWTGLAFLTSGIFNIYLSLKLKNLHKNWDQISPEIVKKYQELETIINSELEKNKS